MFQDTNKQDKLVEQDHNNKNLVFGNIFNNNKINKKRKKKKPHIKKQFHPHYNLRKIKLVQSNFFFFF